MKFQIVACLMFTTLAILSATVTIYFVIKRLETDLCVVLEGYNLLYLPFSEFDFTHCNVWGSHFVSGPSHRINFENKSLKKNGGN